MKHHNTTAIPLTENHVQHKPAKAAAILRGTSLFDVLAAQSDSAISGADDTLTMVIEQLQCEPLGTDFRRAIPIFLIARVGIRLDERDRREAVRDAEGMVTR